MSDIIKYKDCVTTKWEYKDVEVEIDELWEDWKDQDSSIVKPLIILAREKDATIAALTKERDDLREKVERAIGCINGWWGDWKPIVAEVKQILEGK